MKTIIEMAKECELLAGNAEHGIYAMALTRFADLVTDQANERANTSWALMCEKMVEADRKSQERNFCPRCGKRTADLTVVHTCTPPASQITDSVTGRNL